MASYGTLRSEANGPTSANLWQYVTMGAGLVVAVAGLTTIMAGNTANTSLFTVPATAASTTVSTGVRVPTYGGVPHQATRMASNMEMQYVEQQEAQMAQAYANQVPMATAGPSPVSLMTIGGLMLAAVALAAKFINSAKPKPEGLPPMDMNNIAMAACSGERKKIVITGMGICSVFGNDVDKFYEELVKGTSGIKMIDKFDTDPFPTKFAAQITDFSTEGLIPPKVDRRYDETIRYSAVASKKALMQAGIEKVANPDAWEKLEKSKVGVLIGSGMGGLSTLETGVNALRDKGVKGMSPFVIPYSIANMGGGLVGIDQGFMGPNYSIATACASANYAFTAAADHIRSGRADVMVTGGSEGSICPVGLGGFVACRALSKNNEEFASASKPWDQNRDGFVMGEGAGVLIFESEEHALARGATIIAEYLGGAVTCDAYHVTMPREDGLGVRTAMEMAIEDARVEKDQVNYINAHATSTPAGDAAEVRAVKNVFGGNMAGKKMNATKSMIGHCLGAAGALEAIATIKAITTGEVHPSMNITNPIEEADGIDICNGKSSKHTIHAGMSNSFGFGGHNSAVLFGPYTPSE